MSCDVVALKRLPPSQNRLSCSYLAVFLGAMPRWPVDRQDASSIFNVEE
jgi:hypothetical protein